MRSVLHITPWYPTAELPGNAIWIQRHIESLSPHVSQHVLHIEVEFGGIRWKRIRGDHYTGYSVRLPFKIWRLREWISAFLLWWFCMTRRANKNYEVANFHIAYPVALYAHRMRSWLPAKLIITEHWSYYHFHFYSTKKLQRIKNIFHRGIPVIAVSHALAFDIERFSQSPVKPYIIPNVVDEKYFFRNKDHAPGPHLFMAAFWKPPKNPFAVMHALQVLKEKGVEVRIRIGGWGPLLDQMRDQAAVLGIDSQVVFLNKLSQEQMAEEFNRASAFILPSAYETFSVVCAESLCCGCPVLTEPLGALPELVTPGNGLTREEKESWSSLIQRFMEHAPFDRDTIAEMARNRYNKNKVGAEYAAIIQSL